MKRKAYYNVGSSSESEDGSIREDEPSKDEQEPLDAKATGKFFVHLIDDSEFRKSVLKTLKNFFGGYPSKVRFVTLINAHVCMETVIY